MATYEYVVDLDWNGPGAPGVSVWHFRAEGTVPGSGPQEAVDAIGVFWQSVMTGGFLPQGATASGRTEVVNVADRSIEDVTGWTHTSSSSVSSFLGQSMMCLTLATSQATRSGRGRKFIGPITTALADAQGTPTSGAIDQLQAAGQALVDTSVAGTEWAIGVYSRTDGVFRDLVSTRVRDYFAVLRSRRD